MLDANVCYDSAATAVNGSYASQLAVNFISFITLCNKTCLFSMLSAYPELAVYFDVILTFIVLRVRFYNK